MTGHEPVLRFERPDPARAARLPTRHGTFTIHGFESEDGASHTALVLGELAGPPLLVRVHSECLTGDVFGSLRCDCGQQLLRAMELIAEEGRGVVVYLRGHEGRGIGLDGKLRAYVLQDEGLDTVDANLALGYPVDARSFIPAARILRALGVERVRLLTNNPAKCRALDEGGLDVVERVPLLIPPTTESLRYLRTKQRRLGHRLDLSLNRTEEAGA